MKLMKAAAFAAALLAGTALAPTTSIAGPFILAGTDADDHGFANAGGNQDGWLFMQRAIENLAPGVTNGKTTVVSLGSSSTALAAASSAFNLSSLSGAGGYTFVNIDGETQITTFLASGAAANAAIIMLDSGGNVGGGLTNAEEAALTANAANLNAFLGGGGALFSQSNSYGFLSALVPGLTTTFIGGQGITLTAAGAAAFPGLTNQDLSAGPYHNEFTNVGTIPVLGTAASGTVIIGASGGTITNPNPPTSVPEPMSLALFGVGLASLGMVRRRKRAA